MSDDGLHILTEGFPKAELKMDLLMKNCPEAGFAMVEANARVYERGMKRRCPVGRTGGLRNSIKAVKESASTWKVGTSKTYAGNVEWGTGLHGEYPGATPHRIVPVHARFLAWTSYGGKGLKNGTSVVVPSTAGMKAKPFVRPTLHEDKEAAQHAGEVAARVRIAKGAMK